MTQPRWSDDDALMADLRDALLLGGRPDDRHMEMARGAFAWHRVEEDLAAPTDDSRRHSVEVPDVPDAVVVQLRRE